MKRMVKNGDLIDGKSINAVEANPTDEATETLTKLKVGETTYGIEGGGGGGGDSNDKVLTLILPYPKTSKDSSKYVTIDDTNVWNNLLNYYYETIKIYYNDGYPLGVFNVIDYYDYEGRFKKRYSTFVPQVRGSNSSKWYGQTTSFYYSITLSFTSRDGVNQVSYNKDDDDYINFYSLDKAKFDDLYKLADKPTQDGTYVLKATVSGGAVTYAWVAQ